MVRAWTKRLALLLALALCLASLIPGLAQAAIQLSFLCFEDRNECAVYADLLARLSAENPDIAVTVEVVAGG